ncbi:hypothetical protein DL96DRAFT_1601366 [Flagelloscypha sp. PMI_526]|nr:hypothetical protein DL96DRAFT_1601366 [Flagelloscypha sp. PMI_526]
MSIALLSLVLGLSSVLLHLLVATPYKVSSLQFKVRLAPTFAHRWSCDLSVEQPIVVASNAHSTFQIASDQVLLRVDPFRS